MIRWSYTTVQCPISRRAERLPVNTLYYQGKPFRFVNTCDNAPGNSPECALCVQEAHRRLKDRELP